MAEASALPPIDSRGIYNGKFKDMSPGITAAGKFSASGENVVACFKPEQRPPSPEVIKRFRATFNPGPGEKTVFYGKAYDPHRQWAKDMTHGVNTVGSLGAAPMVNPQPKTLFEQKQFEKQELLYASHKKKPLGQSHDQKVAFPKDYPWSSRVYGVVTHRDGNAGELVNPPKSFTEVEDDTEMAHDMYVYTHQDYYPGEQLERRYNSGGFEREKQFGHPTPHDNTGSSTYKSLKWVHDLQNDKASQLVSKRLDNFRERSQNQLGRTLDPIKDTMKVGPDHVFGTMVRPDPYGAGDLIHRREQGSALRGRDHMRGVVSALRHHLKKANYLNFDSLKEAFMFYDKTGTGKIDLRDLATVCHQLRIPTDPDLLAQVIDYCDVNRDGLVDYAEFSNFLNYNMDTESLAWRDEKDHPVDLAKQIDQAIGSHRTSASMINATSDGPPTRGWRTYGVPTVRHDLPAPRLKGVSDTTNYGDEAGSHALLNPSIYSNVGVYEKDFLNPRPKEEIRVIFTNIGVQMTPATFDKIFSEAAARHPQGKVSVESFRNILDEIQAEVIKETDAKLLSKVNC